MTTQNTGSPASPVGEWKYDKQNNVLTYQESGMTLRDYFAAHASEKDIQIAMLSVKRTKQFIAEDKVVYGMPKNARQIARYIVADFMLEARK